VKSAESCCFTCAPRARLGESQTPCGESQCRWRVISARVQQIKAGHYTSGVLWRAHSGMIENIWSEGGSGGERTVLSWLSRHEYHPSVSDDLPAPSSQCRAEYMYSS
jgi:hypothetical protein